MSVPSPAHGSATSECSNCGAAISSNAKFCAECGALQTAPPTSSREPVEAAFLESTASGTESHSPANPLLCSATANQISNPPEAEVADGKTSTKKKLFMFYGMVAVVIVLACIGVWYFGYLRSTERQKATDNYNLGLALQYGQGVPRDDAQAVSWYRKAAEHGNADAQSQLGWAYENGYGGLAKNDSEAIRWYRKAAEQGSSLGQYNLGGAFYYGRGVQLDYTQAVNWYRKSADQGYMSAQHNLAGMFSEGKGVAKDDVEAVRWWRKAADQGDAESQFNLGIMYEYGRGGLANDNAQALSLFQKAADQGYALAKDAPARMQQEHRNRQELRL